MRRAVFLYSAVLLMSLFLFTSCSTRKMAVGILSDTLSSAGSGTTFTGEEDPQLLADALPFAMKVYEALIAENPEHPGLLETTGSLFVMYSNAFVQTPADMLPEDQWRKQQQERIRAKALYLRGRNYALRSVGTDIKDFTAAALGKDRDQFITLLDQTTEDDIAALYWAGAGWMAAYSVDPFDMELALNRTRAGDLVLRAYELDPDWNKGTLDDFFISYYGGLPEAAGGSLDKTYTHYQRAVKKSDGNRASPHVALAQTAAVKEDDPELFRELLEKALAVNIDSEPSSKTANILSQRKAQWLLDHIGDFFLLPEDY